MKPCSECSQEGSARRTCAGMCPKAERDGRFDAALARLRARFDVATPPGQLSLEREERPAR